MGEGAKHHEWLVPCVGGEKAMVGALVSTCPITEAESIVWDAEPAEMAAELLRLRSERDEAIEILKADDATRMAEAEHDATCAYAGVGGCPHVAIWKATALVREQQSALLRRIAAREGKQP